MTLRRLAILLTAAASVALSVTVPAQAAPSLSTQDSGAVFTALPPTRIFDSRTSSKIEKYTSRPVAIPADLVPDNATAVVFNLTGTNPDFQTYLATGPGDQGSPSTSSLNLDLGETRANLVTVALGHGAHKGIWIGAGPYAADAIVDLAGYYAPGAGSKYTPLTPQRVLDTRDSSPLGAGGTVTLDLSSKVPAGATSAVFNLTATDVTGPTFVTAYPADRPRPDASNLNLVAGRNTPNLVTVALSPDRKVKLTNSYWSVDLIADLAGYYSPTSTQAFYSLYPTRVLETRDMDGGPKHPIQAGESRKLDLSGWLPAGATAAVTNLTGTNVSQSTVVTAWADGTPKPGVSNLNLVPYQTSANLAIVPVSGDRAIDLDNLAGQVDMVVDLAGYFAPPIPACTTNCAFGIENNFSGQFGNGTTDTSGRAGPVFAYGLKDVKSIVGSVNGSAVYALKSDGTVWSWGGNGEGQLGIGKYGHAEGPTGHPYAYPPPAFYSTLPVQIPGLHNIVAIADEMALDADGHVHTWGVNTTWQLGTGSTDGAQIAGSPVQVPNLDNVKAISVARSPSNLAGITRFVMTNDGKVWSWGDNSRGALGVGTHADLSKCFGSDGATPGADPSCASATPVQVVGLSGCDELGSRVVLCKSNGSVWRWGGLGISAENDSPVSLPATTGTVTHVQRDAADVDGARGILANGRVWQWDDGAMYVGDTTGALDPWLASVASIAEGLPDRVLATDSAVYETGHPMTSPIITGVTTIGDGGYGVVGTP
ncbi:hypothetical protein [Kutzneria sp. 744]|uniref:RCC1 domain-containing protein n=1 Tax=Kutzneria sp. (strain 744) TaxID=345341 RepID=UPI0012F78C97|nr:hypothetical protein [Kutzneria sp. 744]